MSCQENATFCSSLLWNSDGNLFPFHAVLWACSKLFLPLLSCACAMLCRWTCRQSETCGRLQRMGESCVAWPLALILIAERNLVPRERTGNRPDGIMARCLGWWLAPATNFLPLFRGVGRMMVAAHFLWFLLFLRCEDIFIFWLWLYTMPLVIPSMQPSFRVTFVACSWRCHFR